jgi:hypothetical protein
MTRNFLIIFVLAFTLSCSSDDDNGTAAAASQPTDPGFYGLQVGNWWVYKNYKRNSNTEIYDDTGVIDSISIVGTEQINGNTYFKFRRNTTGNETGITFCNDNGEHFEYLRDSVGNLINEDGDVRFTNTNFSERVLDSYSWGTLYEILRENEASKTVEAGVFNCNYSERYAKSPAGEQFPGLDRFYYAEGIGLIFKTTSFISSEIPTVETRLDSYFVQ